ncbi:MAG: glycosyltransferase family 1 protein [Anaerolineae bacterium]
MRVGIDYTAAARQRAGIGRYTRGLIHALAALDRDNRYTLFVPRDARYIAPGAQAVERAEDFPSNFQLVRAPLDERTLARLWQRLALPLPVEFFVGRCEVWYSPDFVLPPTRAHKKILTVHDLSFKRVPETAVPNLKWYLEGAVPRAVRRADLILADSEATRNDLIELFSAPANRVQKLYSGVEAFFCRVTDAHTLDSVRARYQLERPFILSVGTIEPRKNLARLIEAFARLPRREEWDLVIAGGRGWMYQEILDAPAQFGANDRVRFLGFVPDADLPALYTLATLFVYPSLYEGFGLPVLEAMACGTPLITSNVSSMPEVAGEAGILVNPRDTEELTAAIRQLIDDEALRRELAERGLKQATKFSWQASAQQLLNDLKS